MAHKALFAPASKSTPANSINEAGGRAYAFFPEHALATADLTPGRLAEWYRRFVEVRSADAAERTLATAAASLPVGQVAAMMLDAATDHVFLDEGHTIDFTNKALEALTLAGDDLAGSVLTSLVGQTCSASRSEESSEWRYPVDLGALAEDGSQRLATALRRGGAEQRADELNRARRPKRAMRKVAMVKTRDRKHAHGVGERRDAERDRARAGPERGQRADMQQHERHDPQPIDPVRILCPFVEAAVIEPTQQCVPHRPTVPSHGRYLPTARVKAA